MITHAASRKHYYTVLLDRPFGRSFLILIHVPFFGILLCLYDLFSGGADVVFLQGGENVGQCIEQVEIHFFVVWHKKAS